MKFDYWTIRFQPFPVGLTVYGIGVVAADPRTGEFGYKKVSTPTLNIPKNQQQELAQDLLDGFFRNVDALKARGNALELSEQLELTAYLNWSVRNSNNSLVVDGPFSMEQDSLESALEMLRQFLLEPQRTRGVRRKKTIVRETAAEEYMSRGPLKDRVHIHPILTSSGQEKKLDIAVSDEAKIYEISSAFNFNTDPDAHKQNATDSWNYRISELRRSGGKLRLPEQEKALTVPSGVPVTALYYPPRSQDEVKFFKECTKDWQRLGVESIPLEKVSSHADALVERLTA